MLSYVEVMLVVHSQAQLNIYLIIWYSDEAIQDRFIFISFTKIMPAILKKQYGRVMAV